MKEPATRYRLSGMLGGREIVFDLRSVRTLVGSSPECGLQLKASGLSRRHAQLTVHDGGLVVEDLGSKNGTFVDGEQVRRAAVAAGVRLRLGTVDLEVQRLDPGLDLVLRFETSDAASSMPAPQPTETLILAPSPVDQGSSPNEMLQLERMLAGWPFEDAEQATALLGESLDLSGAVWLKWRGEQPLSEGAWGSVGVIPGVRQVRELLDSAEGSGDGSVAVGTPATDSSGRVAVCRVEGQLHSLLIWTGSGRPAPSPALLQSVARLIPARRGEVPLSVDRHDTPSLEFPDGYVRGRSQPMTELYRQMASLVRGRRPILIQGETGVGKELIARSVHLSSELSSRPFLAVNCAAIPENLVESELFGIVKGAASGVDSRPGYFVRAEGGTLFLDEIGELPTGIQAKLLRALQESEIQPVGGTPRSVEVRIVAATNVDPRTQPEAGRELRSDLFYRFAGGLLRVPTLRDCPRDIPHLVSRMLRRACREERVTLHGVTARAMDVLRSYSWPGNVRELEQEMWRLAMDRPASGIVDVDDLPVRMLGTTDPSPEVQVRERQELSGSLLMKPRIDALQKRLVREAMIRAGGHIGNAAELLGLSRVGLSKMLDRLELRETWARPPSA